MISRNDITAILLAGGTSRRLGRDKRTLVLEGRTLLERSIMTLGKYSRKVLALGNPPEGLHLPSELESRVRWIPDRLPDAGPLAAVAAVINQVESDGVLISAVDYPWAGKMLSVAVAAGSYETREDVVGWVPTEGGHEHTLCALYRTEVWQGAWDTVRKGDRRVRRYLGPYFEADQIRGIPVGSLGVYTTNVNTANDWRKVSDSDAD